MGPYNTKHLTFHPCVGVSFIEMSSAEFEKWVIQRIMICGLNCSIYKPGFQTQSINFGLSPPSTRFENLMEKFDVVIVPL